MIKVVCVCFAVIVYVAAETCDVESVHQCMKNAMGTPPPVPKEAEEMKTKFEKCFTDASCKLPTPKEEDKTVQECRKGVMDKVKADVEKCVQKTNADFKFPTEDHMGHHEHPAFKGHFDKSKGKGKGKGKGKDAFFDKLLNESCPNADAQASVKTCLHALKPSGTPPPKESGGSSEKRKAFCQKKTECFSKLSDTCQKQMEDTKTALCQCAKDVITPQATQLEASLEACKPAGDDKSVKSSEKHKSSTPGDFLIKKFCMRDKCEKS